MTIYNCLAKTNKGILNMKRFLSVLLCVVMALSMIAVMVGCGKEESTTANASDSEIEYIDPADSTGTDIEYTEPTASDTDISE